MKQIAAMVLWAVLVGVVLASCGRNKNAQTTGSAGLSPTAATYMPRIGVALTTGGRTCVAIHNANLTPGTPLTLITPMPPQTTTQAEIAGTPNNPCPITKDVDTTVSNYDLQVPAGATLTKLTPLIAVTGTAAPLTMGPNNNVHADLDQNGKTETFRACSANDGIHLTVWSGDPLNGTLLWHGYYYEAGNPGLGPACTPKEMAAP